MREFAREVIICTNYWLRWGLAGAYGLIVLAGAVEGAPWLLVFLVGVPVVWAASLVIGGEHAKP